MGNLKYKDRHKHSGLCCDCSRPAYNGTRRCVIHTHSHRHIEARYERSHKEYRNKLAHEHKEQYRKEGRCPGCGGPRDDMTKINCVNCRIKVQRPKNRGGYAAHIQNGSS